MHIHLNSPLPYALVKPRCINMYACTFGTFGATKYDRSLMNLTCRTLFFTNTHYFFHHSTGSFHHKATRILCLLRPQDLFTARASSEHLAVHSNLALTHQDARLASWILAYLIVLF